jgi:hypothetical protein
LAPESGALEEEPVTKDQALRVRRRVVRIGIHDPERVNSWRLLGVEFSDTDICMAGMPSSEDEEKQATRRQP